MSAHARLRRDAETVRRRMESWPSSAWRQAVPGGSARAPATTRGDAVHATVARLADLAAEAEGRPHRPVPRLDSDFSLPDQLTIMIDDLIATGDQEAMRAASALLRDVADRLGMRI